MGLQRQFQIQEETGCHWRDEFAWRAAEARINRFPQFTAAAPMPNGTSLDIHFVHEKGSGDSPLPLLLMHGWPGSIAEFLDVIEPLAHPERFGGDPNDGFDVIASSLPGFGFSGIPPITIGPQAVGGMMSHLMRDVLGYERYVAQGGDWGGIIAARIALDHPEDLAVLHTNILPLRPSAGPDDTPNDSAPAAAVELGAAPRQRHARDAAGKGCPFYGDGSRHAVHQRRAGIL